MIKFNTENLKSKIPAKKAGFTLVEMMVAVGLFALIASISLGAILSIFDANRRSQTSKTVVDNLNFTIENMARTVRFGSSYHSCNYGNLTQPANCNTEAASDVLAVRFQGDTIVYRRCGNSIRWSPDGDSDCNDMEPITSPDTVVQYLRFYVFGATDSPSLQQPYVVAVMKGYVGNKPTIQSSFSVETVMSQRRLDI